MRTRTGPVSMRASWLALIALGALAAVGCGPTYYAATVNGAAARLDQARAMGAETRAPYEFYYAKAHLEQAQVEAAQASYGDAAAFAETADEYAQKAIERSLAAPKPVGAK